MPFDLSKVLFITTANLLEPIQPAFRDRMEVIEIHGYTEEEKIEIARRHLIPRQIEANGLTPQLIEFTPGALKKIIALYTREAGVRNLEREIGGICRKVAHKVAEGERKLYKITCRNLEKYAGVPKLFRDQLLEEDSVGVATGMAWTPYGGDILFIEVQADAGQGHADPDRVAGRRHEGVGQRRPEPDQGLARRAASSPPKRSKRTTSTSTSPRAASPRTAPRPASPWPRP